MRCVGEVRSFTAERLLAGRKEIMTWHTGPVAVLDLEATGVDQRGNVDTLAVCGETIDTLGTGPGDQVVANREGRAGVER